MAKKFSQKLNRGDVVFLYGEIGVGKTTFVRYLINNLQIKNNLKLTEVTSPTFNIVNEYEVGKFTIKHYDFFRLSSIQEIKNIGLLEDNDKSLTLIEWPEKIENLFKNKISLYFEYDENINQRFVTVEALE